MPPAKLKLSVLLDLLDSDRAGYVALLDLETGESVIMEGRLVEAARRGDRAVLARVPVWQIPDAELAEVIAKDAEGRRFIAGPDRRGFGERGHMERFIGSLENAGHADQLRRALEGADGVSQFKDMVDRLDLLDGWLAWRDAAMKAYVRAWAEERGFPVAD